MELRSGECNVVSLYVLCCPVNGSVCFVCLGVIAILLSNVMEVFSVGGSTLLDRPCMVFQRMCVLCLYSQCASKCSFHRFCFCFCMLEVISSFRHFRAGSQVFALLRLFLCVI